MIRNATHKLVYRPRGESEFYRLDVDPRELNNLFPTASNDPSVAAAVQALTAQLLEWYTQTADVTPVEEDDRDAPPFYSCVPPGQVADPVLTAAMVPCASGGSGSAPSDMLTMWSMASSSGPLQVVGASSSQCLAVGNSLGPDPADGRNVTLAPCDPSDPQQSLAYDASSGLLQNAKTATCLDVSKPVSFGEPPIFYPCDHKTWVGLPWSILRANVAGSPAVGGPIMLSPLDGDDEQWCLGVCATV